MNEQYVIFGDTLDAVANAIRVQTHKTNPLNPLDFSEAILSIDLTTEEYMQISDYLDYPELINENNYTEKEVAKCQALIDFYTEKEAVTNGK